MAVKIAVIIGIVAALALMLVLVVAAGHAS